MKDGQHKDGMSCGSHDMKDGQHMKHGNMMHQHEKNNMSHDGGMRQHDDDTMHDHQRMDMTSMQNSDKQKIGPKGGVEGLADSLHLKVLLDGVTTDLDLEETEFAGVYQAKFTPETSNYPIVYITGDIFGTVIDLEMHPEKIEEQSTLSPLKQIEYGILPEDVKCKEGFNLYMRVHSDSVICASDIAGKRMLALGIIAPTI